MLTDGEHQVGAVHALDATKATGAADPDRWHAIRRGQQRSVEDVTERRVPLCLHHAMHTGDADIAAPAPCDRGEDRIDGHRDVDRIDANAEDVDALAVPLGL